ncbi:MAG TPA: hypothetical protein V6C81_25610 [Planktothrix sp.]
MEMIESQSSESFDRIEPVYFRPLVIRLLTCMARHDEKGRVGLRDWVLEHYSELATGKLAHDLRDWIPNEIVQDFVANRTQMNAGLEKNAADIDAGELYTESRIDLAQGKTGLKGLFLEPSSRDQSQQNYASKEIVITIETAEYNSQVSTGSREGFTSHVSLTHGAFAPSQPITIDVSVSEPYAAQPSERLSLLTDQLSSMTASANIVADAISSAAPWEAYLGQIAFDYKKWALNPYRESELYPGLRLPVRRNVSNKDPCAQFLRSPKIFLSTQCGL